MRINRFNASHFVCSMALALFAIIGVPSATLAVPVQIDFNVAGFGPAPGTTNTFTKSNVHGDLDLTFRSLNEALALSGNLYWDADDGNGFADGFGVMGAGHAGDEIEGPERLRLDFSKALHLLTFNVTDFFNEKEPSTDDCMPGDPACYLERGSFMLLFGDGTSSGWNFFQALATSLRSTNGVQDIAVNMDNVVGMIFSAPGITTEGGMTKYEELSVAGIKFNDSATPVPEPATMFLVGAGIAGILAKRRRA